MARHYRFFLRNPDSNRLLEQKKETLHLREDVEPEIVFQLVKVLRAKPGDVVTLRAQGQEGAASGAAGLREYVFEVTAASKNAVELLQKEVRTNTNELSFALNLWLCLANKPDKLEFILEKAVEIGATKIVLFESDFTQMKHQLRIDRLQKIVMEAAEQSERAVVPELEVKGSLSRVLKAADTMELGRVWVAMERMEQTGMPGSGAGRDDTAANPFSGAQKNEGISILVGPEGGFSEAEKELMAGLSLQKFSLGKRILRMETAAVLSLGLAALLDS